MRITLSYHTVGSLFAYFHMLKWQFFQGASMEPPLYLPLHDVFFHPPALSMHPLLQDKYMDPSLTKQKLYPSRQKSYTIYNHCFSNPRLAIEYTKGRFNRVTSLSISVRSYGAACLRQECSHISVWAGKPAECLN